MGLKDTKEGSFVLHKYAFRIRELYRLNWENSGYYDNRFRKEKKINQKFMILAKPKDFYKNLLYRDLHLNV